MGKGNISRPKKGTSVHSRAARRATAPDIDTDKSLKNVKAPSLAAAQNIGDDARQAVLGVHAGSGISKRSSNKKTALSAKARRRQEKSQDKAEAIMDRTAKKVERSKGQARVIFSRRKTWDEVNKHALSVVAAGGKPGAVPVGRFMAPDEDLLGDDDDSDTENNAQEGGDVMMIEEAPIASSASIPPPPPPDVEDVIL
ncbi:Alb1-domain-containing protein [Lasiosphaeria ovina]|uniref:Alb1-domain-containing protein n=1 Tax=Lasiosphaeria ovina TaxID=92902 RepID=A0AAE0N7J1_9PEZI|nr:Alb1-domain-containing protein [Lasiosphaeria ovina]